MLLSSCLRCQESAAFRSCKKHISCTQFKTAGRSSAVQLRLRKRESGKRSWPTASRLQHIVTILTDHRREAHRAPCPRRRTQINKHFIMLHHVTPSTSKAFRRAQKMIGQVQAIQTLRRLSVCTVYRVYSQSALSMVRVFLSPALETDCTAGMG